MNVPADRPSLLIRFLTGCVAPVVVAGVFLAWQGEGALARLGALGSAGSAAGAGVFVVTLLLPCGLLALAGRRLLTCALAGFLLPLGILAADGISLAAAGSEPVEASAEDEAVREALRVVWSPVRSLARSHPAPDEAADETAGLRRRVVDLEETVRVASAERDSLRVALEGAQALIQGVEPEAPVARPETDVAAFEKKLRTAQDALALSRTESDQLRAKLLNVETGLLDARREADGLRQEILVAKDAAAVAKDDAALATRKLEQRIAELEARSTEERIEEIRTKAFAPVGIVMKVAKPSAGGGLSIHTNVDAARVHGPGIVLTPQGKPIAVIQCEIGRGESLGAHVLFTPARFQPTVGDVVYARIK